MVDVGELIINISSALMTISVLLLRNTISLAQYSYYRYPQFTLIIFSLIGTYILYKFILRIVKMWISLFITMIKILFTILFVAFAFTIYLRGWKFVQQDLPYLKNLIVNLNKDEVIEKFKWNNLFVNSIFHLFNSNEESNYKASSNSLFDEYGIEIDPSYFDYINERFNPKDNLNYEQINEFVHDNIDSFNEFLHNQGVDLNEIGNNFINNFVHQNR